MSGKVLNTFQYTVGTVTANQIGTPMGSARDDRTLIITNLNTNTVWFGSKNNISSITGAAIPGNNNIVKISTSANVYVITASAGSTITVAEIIGGGES